MEEMLRFQDKMIRACYPYFLLWYKIKPISTWKRFGFHLRFTSGRIKQIVFGMCMTETSINYTIASRWKIVAKGLKTNMTMAMAMAMKRLEELKYRARRKASWNKKPGKTF